MIIRKLENNKIVVIELGYNTEQEQEFIEINQTGGFMLVDSLPYSDAYPEYSNYKWESGAIVVDDVENEKQSTTTRVQEYKDYLTKTDFKMTADYDQDTTDVTILRQQARDFIRLNQVD